MYEVCKTWLKAHAPILLVVALVLLLALYFFSGRENVPSDSNRTQDARIELESIADDNRGVEERIGAAKESDDRIEESAERSGHLIDEAERLTRDCQQIITRIYRRGEESTETP
ncbi:hypothetical protein [Phascolarctobacterium faecium]|uniref:hypothetical protein n=1 Tax=Phascolarctobacterium faecium TaxID=33025 RepID=UPI00351FD358